MLINGDKLQGDDEVPISNPVFLPYPEKEGWYILLYESRPKNGYEIKDKKLYYAEINAKANNGQGEVVTQQVKIHNDYHYTFTVSGYCNNSYYWIAIDRNDNINQNIQRDRIYFYRIDEYGVSLQPKINSWFNIGNSGGYKFSPNGDKLFFSYQGNWPANNIDNVIANFNFLTGELYNYREIYTDSYYPVEFSPDSRFMYFISNDSILCQVDARYSSDSRLNRTRITIKDFSSIINGEVAAIDFQLAPDGKIYFIYYERDNYIYRLGRINNPNTPGIGCNVELDIIPINNLNRFPEFVTSFFRDKTPKQMDEQMADAGPDVEICSFSNIKIGTEGNNDALYYWSPEENIDDPLSSAAEFLSISQVWIPDSVKKILTVTDGNCWINFDTMIVSVLPVPIPAVIDGSWSVCPYVEEVDYWVMQSDSTLQWLVNGGEIIYGNSPDSIKVNWWDTNSNALVSAVVTNNYGCVVKTDFPVRINVELITETPNGPDDLCVAEAKNVTYKIKNTNGSVYEWIAEGGEVVSGQGSNKVIVNWKEGNNKLSVLESSTTIDTICFGESQPLFVKVINDSLEISLTNVSFDPNNNLEVYFASDRMNLGDCEFNLFAENVIDGTIDEYQVESSDVFRFIYPSNPRETGSQIITLEVVNRCDEVFYSNILQTVALNGEVLPDALSVSLTWNLNRFWEADRLKHEIWHSSDGTNNWQLIETVDGQTVFDYQYQNVSLYHYFRVKEINLDKNLESWSNTINVEIDDTLLIPDVFTPNGDGFNDVWEIRNIIFHPFKSLTVFNKSGKPVYNCRNEFIPWDGKINDEIFQGTYFYQVTFEGGNIRYGQITVLQ